MMMTSHGHRKFPKAEVLASSADRHWTDIAAELRSHPAGEIPPITSNQIEVTLTLSGDGSGFVHRRGDGTPQQTAVAPGTLWLCPSGVQEDSILISQPIERVAHIYFPPALFMNLSRDGRGGAAGPSALGYIAGLQDPLVEQMILAIVSEMLAETAGGKLLVESLALSIAVRMIGSYSVLPASAPGGEAGSLDRTRLARVLDFIMTEIEGDLSIERLAEIACLSRFHFSRAFSNSMGMSPHRYVSGQRLAHAQNLLVASDRSISDIAAACGFSSQGNFHRAFVRATGSTPGRYRSQAGRKLPLDV